MNSPLPQSTERDDRDLLLEYIDGRLSDEDLPRFNQLLLSRPELLTDLAEFLVMEIQLHDILQEQREQARLAAERPAPQAGSAWLSGNRAILAAGLGLAAVIACVIYLGLREPAEMNARVAALRGSGIIERGGRTQAAAAGTELQSGDRVKLNAGSSATVSCPRQGASLRIWDSADLTFQAGRGVSTVAVRSGSVSAGVRSGPGAPSLRFRTPHAEATASRAELTFSVGAEGTRLSIWDGRATITRIEDGAATDVTSHECAVVRPGTPLVRTAIRYGLVREVWRDTPDSDPWPRQSTHSASRTDGWEFLEKFESRQQIGPGSVTRVRGYVRPTSSGSYRFWIEAADAAELWMSPDEVPEHRAKLCWTAQWTEPQLPDRQDARGSPPIHLEAGHSYYLEVVEHEREGVGCLSVSWLPPTGSRQVIPGQNLLPAP